MDDVELAEIVKEYEQRKAELTYTVYDFSAFLTEKRLNEDAIRWRCLVALMAGDNEQDADEHFMWFMTVPIADVVSLLASFTNE